MAESDPEIDFVHAVDVFGACVKPLNLDPGKTVLSEREYGARYLKREITWLSATHMFYRATPERLTDPFSHDIFPLMDNEFIVRRLLDKKVGFLFELLFYTRYVETSVTAGLGGLDGNHPIFKQPDCWTSRGKFEFHGAGDAADTHVRALVV